MEFTNKALKAIEEGNQNAVYYSYGYTNVKNLLLGLMKSKDSQAYKVLTNAGIKLESLYLFVSASNITNVAQTQVSKNYNATPTIQYEKVLNRSEEYRVQTNQDKISTGMILLAILDLIDEIPDIYEYLETNLVDIEDLMEELIDLIGENEDSLLNFDAKSLNRIVKDGSLANLSTTDSGVKIYKRPLAPYSTLMANYSINLTDRARTGKIDPIIGRDKELNRVIQILGRKTKNNPVLIGDPGVGKTSVAEALALKIESGDVPEHLREKVIYSLNIGSMLAGAKYRGDFEERLKQIINECMKRKEILLFVDELHMVVGTGKGEGNVDAANILKPYLSDGSIQMIGATTIDEYRKIIETDRALERRFQPVTIMEPTEQETLDILHGVKQSYENFHHVTITNEAIEAAVKLSVRYLTDRFLPDKALDVIDEAASAKKIFKEEIEIDSQDEKNILATQYHELYEKKCNAILSLDIKEALDIRNTMIETFDRINSMDYGTVKENTTKLVTEEDVCKVIAGWTHIPVSKMNEDEKTKLLNMENIMSERIIGQEEAISSICTAIRRNSSGLRDPKKPIASFMFLGSTGVGKTETVKVLAKTHYGSEDNIVRLDMSEYMEKHSVSRLIGAPPGYVGHDDGGFLTNAIRTKPYSIILFDEIEKAHPDVFNVLLQVLDDGRLTDSKGRVVDFKNTIIIMTSNLGFQKGDKIKEKTLGFSSPSESKEKKEKDEYIKIKERTLEACRKHFRPEFLNRIDETIVFHTLTDENIKDIINLLCKDLMSRLSEKNIQLTLSDEVINFLVKKGTNLEYGARPLSRAIQKYLMDTLSIELLSDNIINGDKVVAKINEDESVIFEVVKELVSE